MQHVFIVISPTYPWKVPRMFHQQSMKEFFLCEGYFCEVLGYILPPALGAKSLNYPIKKSNLAGDSKWPFDPLVGGHLTFPKGHVFTIPKMSRLESPGHKLHFAGRIYSAKCVFERNLPIFRWEKTWRGILVKGPRNNRRGRYGVPAIVNTRFHTVLNICTIYLEPGDVLYFGLKKPSKRRPKFQSK